MGIKTYREGNFWSNKIFQLQDNFLKIDIQEELFF